MMRALRRSTVAAVAVVLASSAAARADDTIKRPGDHPQYKLEIEPHLDLGYVQDHGDGAFGFGARFSIILMDPGFVRRINDTVGITFGADFLFYRDNVVDFPVALQWNFCVARRWSVFGEPGVVLEAGPGRDNFLWPALWLGGRWHINEDLALTMRIGFPMFSIGLSIM